MSLRDYLRHRAAWVWNEQGHAISNGLVLQEETITEMLLLKFAKDRTKYGLTIKMFTKGEEGINGADWEWIFITRACKISFRVQAKRLYPGKGGYVNLHPTGPQINKLIAHAGSSIPIFVFYNHAHNSNSDKFPTGGDKPYRGPSYWGCSVSHAHTIKSAATCSLTKLIPHTKPWHRMISEKGSCDVAHVLNISPSSTQNSMSDGQEEVIQKIENPNFMNAYLSRKELYGAAIIDFSRLQFR